MHAKFSHYRMYFSKKTNIVSGEEGDESSLHNTKVQNVPGLLATIVHTHNYLFLRRSHGIDKE